MAGTYPKAGALALALTAGLALSACTTGGSTTPGDKKADAKISIALAGDITTLDPAKAANVADLVMARMRFEALVHRDDAGTVVSGLAKSWTATATATSTSAVLTLRDKVTCSDGTTLTATDVANSLKRLADPATGATSAALVFGPGAPTIAADDSARTVTVTTASPYSDLLYGLAQPYAGIVCPGALNDPAKIASGAKGVGTGAYYLDSKVAGSSYTLKPSPGYDAWAGYAAAAAEGGTVPTEVDMKVYANESTMANDLLTGTLDYAGLTGPDTARVVNKGFTIKPSPLVRTFVVINQHPGHPGADPKVRKAIAQAIDQNAFNQAVTKGTGVLMASIVDPSVPCANKDTSLLTKVDPAAAKTVLSGLKLKVEGTNAVAAGIGNTYVQSALNSAGAKAELKNADNATWATDVLNNKGDWDVTVLPNVNLTNLLTTPAGFLVGQDPQHGGRNFGGVADPGFATGFGQAMAATDAAAKCTAWQSAQAAMLANVDVVPLAAINVNYVVAKRATALAPDGIFDPTTMRVTG